MVIGLTISSEMSTASVASLVDLSGFEPLSDVVHCSFIRS